MNRHEFKLSRGLSALSLVLILITWPSFVVAETLHVVNVVPDADNPDHYKESIDFSIYVLEMIRSDINGESLNKPFDNKIRSCTDTGANDTTTVYTRRARRALTTWLELQKTALENLNANDCDGINVSCAPIACGEPDKNYLKTVWNDRKPEKPPALMVMDLVERDAYFYSQSNGIRIGSGDEEVSPVWEAHSPCPEAGCENNEEFLREQRPLYRASRILTLSYLATDKELTDESSRLIIANWIKKEIDTIEDGALWKKDDFDKKIPEITCE